jgi:dimethylamine/trimethylamine dehydrogenase
VRDSRYDILFEPVQLGPVTAKNRFFQVPHCNGMGYRDPSAQAEMRRVKAEGGWAVVCTEQVEIHPSSDISPFIELRLWDEQDFPVLQRICDAIHDGGALAGLELAHNGMNAPNGNSREVPLGPSHLPVMTWAQDPVQARAMTREDIAEFRRWHRAAVTRTAQLGYDIVYVYAGHGFSMLQHFLSPNLNHRSDEYGGSLTNRMRLLREVLEDTREIADGKMAVACRISVQDGGLNGLSRAEIEEMIGTLGELPDLWDFVTADWETDSTTSRFGPEGEHERYFAGLKALTTKPVVGIGRFTSPDEMVRQIRTGVLDMIGAARPSIADPFLPVKIEQGRLEEIRECIGCNICVSGDLTMSNIRCTQNPSMGEEWRRGWHPERIRVRESASRVLVVGGGPSGLEAARALGVRGYEVGLAEASRTLGGRVAREATLPGLGAWIRVRDYREQALGRLENVEVFLQSELTADEIVDYGYDHVVVATGSVWRRDGVARFHHVPIDIDPAMQVLTPDDVLGGVSLAGARVCVYDDDHYYMGGVIAEALAASGAQVELLTPAHSVSMWTANTLEVEKVQRRVRAAGVRVRTGTALTSVLAGGVRAIDVHTDEQEQTPADAVVLVTARVPRDDLAENLRALVDAGAGNDVRAVSVIGDALAPSTIAANVSTD